MLPAHPHARLTRRPTAQALSLTANVFERATNRMAAQRQAAPQPRDAGHHTPHPAPARRAALATQRRCGPVRDAAPAWRHECGRHGGRGQTCTSGRRLQPRSAKTRAVTACLMRHTLVSAQRLRTVSCMRRGHTGAATKTCSAIPDDCQGLRAHSHSAGHWASHLCERGSVLVCAPWIHKVANRLRCPALVPLAPPRRVREKLAHAGPSCAVGFLAVQCFHPHGSERVVSTGTA